MAAGASYFQTQDNLSIRYASYAPDGPAAAGTVILLGGRAEFIEKHQETIEDLTHRHFAVYTMDWCGQGLSDRLLKDRQKGHVDSFDRHIDDLDFFVETIVRPNAAFPLIFLAHSMGGHIALRYLRRASAYFSGAILVSPMINIRTKSVPYPLARKLVRLASRHNWSERYIPGASHYDPEQKPFENNPLTNDPERFMDEKQKIADNPALAIGGVTYGWLSAAFDSIDVMFAADGWKKLTVPILMLGGSADQVISISAMQQMCQRLADCRCVIIQNAKHEILKETNSIRRQFWHEFDQFIKKIM